MNIAIQNIHLTPNLYSTGFKGIHNYIISLVSQNYVKYLYFDECNAWAIQRAVRNFLKNNSYGIPWKNVELIFSAKTLRNKCDVLLNFNTYTGKHDFTSGVKSFDGPKIWHIGDYFWNDPGSVINQYLEKYGIDYLLGYASHDRHCDYFQKTFPNYNGKVIPVPFGFSDRFESQIPFEERKNKCVGLGSVNHLRPLQYPVHNYRETADFYSDESWFHRFRRMLVLRKEQLGSVMDSMFPEFPRMKDFGYDIVAKFNEYRMFVSCESIFFFPSAKAFEGTACGTVMVCADHECNREFGFVDGENCIMYRLYDVDDFTDKVSFYQNHESALKEIQKKSIEFVHTNYSHSAISKLIYERIATIFKT